MCKTCVFIRRLSFVAFADALNFLFKPERASLKQKKTDKSKA